MRQQLPGTAVPTTAPAGRDVTTVAPPTALRDPAPPLTAPTTAPVPPPTRAAAPLTTVPVPAGAPPPDDDPVPLLPALAVVLAVVALGAIAGRLLRGGRGRRPPTGWSSDLRAALDDVEVTVPVVLAYSEAPDPRPFEVVLGPPVRDLRRRLDDLAAQATDPYQCRQIAELADNLQSLVFAAEAEWLLRGGATPPTAEQLAAAGSATASRRAALDRDLAVVRAGFGGR
jgi:hypothetical protein